MNRFLIRAFGLLLFLPLLSTGQQPRHLSLEDCLDFAEKNQPKIKNALLDLQNARAKNKEITGLALPQVNGKASLNYAPLVAAFNVPNFMKDAIGQFVKDSAIKRNDFDNAPGTLPLAFQPKWSTNVSVEANQILFDPTLVIAFHARSAFEALYSKSVDLTKQDVRVAVAKSYFNVLIAENQMGLVEQNIRRMELMEGETREIYKQGLAEKIDVDRITVVLNNLQTQKIRLSQSMALAFLALKFQMGMPLNEEITLKDNLSDQKKGADLLSIGLDVGDRKEYQLLQIQKELFGYEAKRYQQGWIPSLSLFANSGYALFNAGKLYDPADSWQRSALIGTTLNIPIFDGFQRRMKLRQSRISLQKNSNEMENLKQALTLEEEQAKIGLKNNLLALENQERNMELAETVYQTARIKYKEGVGSSLEIMNAESTLKEAQTNYFLALYEVINSRIDLQKALGKL